MSWKRWYRVYILVTVHMATQTCLFGRSRNTKANCNVESFSVLIGCFVYIHRMYDDKKNWRSAYGHTRIALHSGWVLRSWDPQSECDFRASRLSSDNSWTTSKCYRAAVEDKRQIKQSHWIIEILITPDTQQALRSAGLYTILTETYRSLWEYKLSECFIGKIARRLIEKVEETQKESMYSITNGETIWKNVTKSECFRVFTVIRTSASHLHKE